MKSGMYNLKIYHKQTLFGKTHKKITNVMRETILRHTNNTQKHLFDIDITFVCGALTGGG